MNSRMYTFYKGNEHCLLHQTHDIVVGGLILNGSGSKKLGFKTPRLALLFNSRLDPNVKLGFSN